MKYKIGQKVVYIGPDFRSHPIVVRTFLNVPTPRGIYTIRGGRVLPAALQVIAGCDHVGYVLEELVNPEVRCAICGEVMETHINEGWFRPLQERKNDGEAFVAGLRPLLKTRALFAGSKSLVRVP